MNEDEDPIDTEMIDMLVATLYTALQGKVVRFKELVIATSELTGRIVVDHSPDTKTMQAIHKACCEHLEVTIRTGAARKGVEL